MPAQIYEANNAPKDLLTLFNEELKVLYSCKYNIGAIVSSSRELHDFQTVATVLLSIFKNHTIDLFPVAIYKHFFWAAVW